MTMINRGMIPILDGILQALWLDHQRMLMSAAITSVGIKLTDYIERSMGCLRAIMQPGA